MAQNLDDHVSAALAPGKPIVAKLINDILIKFCYLLRASHRSPIAVTHTKLSGGGSPRTSVLSFEHERFVHFATICPYDRSGSIEMIENSLDLFGIVIEVEQHNLT